MKNENRDTNKLVNTLSVYRSSREQLVEDFVREEPEIYRSMFEHKAGSVAMKVAIEQYILLWLIKHPIIYQKLYLSSEEDKSEYDQYLFSFFMEKFRLYCKGFVCKESSQDSQDFNAKNPIIEFLLHEKVKILDELLKANRNSDAKIKHALYQSAKAKALFARQLNELRGNKK